MVIEKGEPWLLWPDKVSFGINTGNIGQTFEGDNSFTLSMRIKILSEEKIKRTIFAKVPNYCGIDVEGNDKLLLILRLKRGDEYVTEYLISDREISYDYQLITYRYNKETKVIEVLIEDTIVIQYFLKENEDLSKENDPHIIFGAGNFPSNNFNMNLCSFEINHLLISKSYLTNEELKSGTTSNEIVGLYDFKQHTEYKVFDLSGNSNFIHKII